MLIALALAAAGCSGDESAGKNETVPATVGTEPVETSQGTAAPTSLAKSVARVRRELRGIPQHGLVLGRRTAPLTIIEYGNFACSRCAAAHETVVPKVIERYVRTGEASLEFRGIAGELRSRSRDLALSAHAASAQRHGWDFLQLAYLRSLTGSAVLSGAPGESSAELAAALGLDARRWNEKRAEPAWSEQVKAAASVAAVARFSVFPVFLVRSRANPGHPFVVLTDPGSVGEFAGAIAKARRPGG